MGKVKDIILLLLIMGVFIVVHESTHFVIYENFGCADVHFTIAQDWSPATTAMCYGLSEDRLIALDLAQANVEAVQYPLLLVIIIISIGLLKQG